MDPTPPVAGLLSAAQVSRDFQAVEVLGEGSFGAVFRAVHKPSQRFCAAKVLALHGCKRVKSGLGVELPRDVLREIDAMQSLKSPFIVSYWAHGIEDPKRRLSGGDALEDEPESSSEDDSDDDYGDVMNARLWIFMDLCEMGSAKDVMDIANQPFEEEATTVILYQALMGLMCIHDAKRIHRDIKSENLFLALATPAKQGSDVITKLGDFGVATSKLHTAALSNRCATVVGTPYFIAPEVISGTAAGVEDTGYDAKADIWSLGITACELRERDPPRFEMDPMRALFFIPQNEPPTLRPQTVASPEFVSFVAACLTKDARSRPDAAQLLKHELFSGPTAAERIARGKEQLRILSEQIASIVNSRGGLYQAVCRAARRSGSESGSVLSVTTFGGSTSSSRESTVQLERSLSQTRLSVARDGSLLEVDARPWVWAPHGREGFLPASIERETASEVLLKYQDGTEVCLAPEVVAGLARLVDGDLTDVSDCTELTQLSSASLLHNIRQRFEKDQVYTFVGSRILIAVNPYKSIPIYSDSDMVGFAGGNLSGIAGDSVPAGRPRRPHVFSVADYAYESIRRDRRNQNLIVGGESGSGKTETTKLFLRYLMRVGNFDGMDTAQASRSALQQRILDSSILLESFGNAKTVRNSNSSRFGKYISISFVGGQVCGANIQHFLLEKSRICSHGVGERSYHIFYQLCYGLNQFEPELAKALSLPSNPLEFDYLRPLESATGQSRSLESSSGLLIDGRTDSERLTVCRSALEAIGVNRADVESLWRTLAGLLHLGDIKFKNRDGKSEAAQVANFKRLVHVANMWGFTPGVLETGLCSRSFSAASRSGSRYSVPLNCSAAIASRDALAKALYLLIFKWLVSSINSSVDVLAREELAQANSLRRLSRSSNTIGILDIFGFEVFENNSFEQLCINFTNERLQGYFNDRIFADELADCEREGVVVSRVDDASGNAGILAMFENKTADCLGLWPVLEEECFFPQSTDFTLMDKLVQNLSGYSAFINMRASTPNPTSRVKRAPSKAVAAGNDSFLKFGVRHYAGDVVYSADRFLDKNNDALHPDLLSLLESSSSDFMRVVAAGCDDAPPASASGPPKFGLQRRPTLKRNNVTLSGKFRAELISLLSTLRSSEGYFVRCIKPNSSQMPNKFDSELALRQLECGGLLEAVRIRKLGFPIRVLFQEFAGRYRCLTKFSLHHDDRANCQAIVHSLVGVGISETTDVTLGRTKVLMKEPYHQQLEFIRERKRRSAVLVLQRFRASILARLHQRERFNSMFDAAHRLLVAARVLNGAARAAHARLMLQRLRCENVERQRSETSVVKQLPAGTSDVPAFVASLRQNFVPTFDAPVGGLHKFGTRPSILDAFAPKSDAGGRKTGSCNKPAHSHLNPSTDEESTGSWLESFRMEAKTERVATLRARGASRLSIAAVFKSINEENNDSEEEEDEYCFDSASDELDDCHTPDVASDRPSISSFAPTLRQQLGLTDAERLYFQFLSPAEQHALKEQQRLSVLNVIKGSSSEYSNSSSPDGSAVGFLLFGSERWKFAPESALPPPPLFRGLRQGSIEGIPPNEYQQAALYSNTEEAKQRQKQMKYFTQRPRRGDIWSPSWSALSERMQQFVEREEWINEWQILAGESKAQCSLALDDAAQTMTVPFDDSMVLRCCLLEHLFDGTIVEILRDKRVSDLILVSTEIGEDCSSHAPSVSSFACAGTGPSFQLHASETHDMGSCWRVMLDATPFSAITRVQWLVFKVWPPPPNSELLSAFDEVLRVAQEQDDSLRLVLHSSRSCSSAITFGILGQLMEQVHRTSCLETPRINVLEAVRAVRKRILRSEEKNNPSLVLEDAISSQEEYALCFRALAADLKRVSEIKERAIAMGYKGQIGLSREFASLLQDLAAAEEETADAITTVVEPQAGTVPTRGSKGRKSEAERTAAKRLRAAKFVDVTARVMSFRKGRRFKALRAAGEPKRVHFKWTHKRPHYIDMAAAGFFFDPSHSAVDRVTCYECCRSQSGWTTDSAPLFEHESLSPGCPCITNARLWLIARDEFGFRYEKGHIFKVQAQKRKARREAKKRLKALLPEQKQQDQQ